MRHLLAACLLLVLASCGAAAGGGEDAVGPGPDALRDAGGADAIPHDAGDTPPDLVGPDVAPGVGDVGIGPCGLTCPPALCDAVAGRCLACTTGDDCLSGEWCHDGRCDRTFCVPGMSDCDPDGGGRITCLADGAAYGAPVACPEGTLCSRGECKAPICTPGETHCAEYFVEECSATGTEWLRTSCPPGEVCLGEGCVPFRNNMVLIFDTSGSMGGGMGMASVPCDCPSGCAALPYPSCEKALCPRTPLGMAKRTFGQLFGVIDKRRIQLVMTRFPQRVSESQGGCDDMLGTGHYQVSMSATSSDWITGDDGRTHITPEGSWFDAYVHEILCAGAPATLEDDGFAAATQWMDFDEQVGAVGAPCTTDAECPAGWCAPDTFGTERCWRHTNPELRATGNTPLGRSLFYAGEYIRKYVDVEGLPCTADEECRNANFGCSASGKCHDPIGHCRSTTVILFTDGVEEPATTTSDFFNPIVQAKRMRYGLDCAYPSDCNEGATCDDGTCEPTSGHAPFVRPTDPEPGQLLGYGGRVIQVTTHVVDMSQGEGSVNNSAIAEAGGGQYFSVSTGEPSALLGALLSVTDIKARTCIPQP